MKLRLIAPMRAGKRKLLPLAVLLILLVIATVCFFVHNISSPYDAEPMPPNFYASIDGNTSEGNIYKDKKDIQAELAGRSRKI